MIYKSKDGDIDLSKITRVYPAAVIEMYGYTKDEIIGKTPEFVSADGKNDLEKISNYIDEAFNNKPTQFEL